MICIICGPFNLVLEFGCDKKAKLQYPAALSLAQTSFVILTGIAALPQLRQGSVGMA